MTEISKPDDVALTTPFFGENNKKNRAKAKAELFKGVKAVMHQDDSENF